MTDALGAASAAVGLFQNAVYLYKFADKVISAPKDKQLLLRSFSQIQDDLQWIEQQRKAIDGGNPACPVFDRLLSRGEDGEWKQGDLLQSLDELFQKITKKLSLVEVDDDAGTFKQQAAKLHNFGKALKWPLVEADVRQKAGELDRLNQAIHQIISQATLEIGQSTLQLARANNDLGSMSVQLSQKLVEDVDELKTSMKGWTDYREAMLSEQQSKQRNQILNWLSASKTIDPFAKIPEYQRVPAKWLIDNDVFKTWHSGRSWPLILRGGPGCGKTMLSACIAQYLKDEARDAKVSQPVLTVYLKYEDHATQSMAKILAFLLKEILMYYRDSETSAAIVDAWNRYEQDGSRPGVIELLGILKAELCKSVSSYIIIDGLDEVEDGLRNEIMDRLGPSDGLKGQMHAEGSQLHLLYTSRPQESSPPLKTASCDRCPSTELSIYYKCREVSVHGDDYYLCEPCSKVVTECRQTHGLYESYEKVEVDLKPPKQVMMRYIEKLIHWDKTIGTSNKSGSFREVGTMTNRSAQGTTQIGRVLSAARNRALESRIIDQIAKTADGSFLLSKCLWDHLKDQVVLPRDIPAALKTLPTGYDDTYKAALKRIDDIQGPGTARKGKKLIMWLSYTKRVLTFQEVGHAMTVEAENFLNPPLDLTDEETDLSIFDPESTKMEWGVMDTHLAATAGLVLVVGAEVRLWHRTAYSFFEQADVRESCFDGRGDSELALISLAYLMHTDARSPCYGTDEEAQLMARIDKFPFVQYASQYWGAHAAASLDDENVRKHTLRFLRDEQAVAAAIQMASFCERIYSTQPVGWDVRRGASPIHIAAWFGLHDLLEELLASSGDVNMRDASGYGRTPLIYACRRRGNEKAIIRLLELGADAKLSDDACRHPLRHAVEYENVDAVRALCEHADIRVDQIDQDNSCSLFVAASKNNGAPIIEVLRKRPEFDINLANSSGCTALVVAVQRNAETPLRTILACEEVDLDSRLSNGSTALHWAAYAGRTNIVDQLLKKGATTHFEDDDGSTALKIAIRRGHGKIVEGIRSHLNTPWDSIVSRDGETALHCACECGRAHFVEMLLSQGSSVDFPNKNGMTALQFASLNGHDDIVTILLQKGANRDLRDNDGLTAFDMAAREGHVSVTHLIDTQAAEIVWADGVQTFSTVVLARLGEHDALRERLATSHDSLLETDAHGNTPLHAAVAEDHIECVRLILQAGKGLNIAGAVNEVDGFSPIRMACDNAALEIVKLLVSHDPAPDLELRDRYGFTALESRLAAQDFDTAFALVQAKADLSGFGAMLPSELLGIAIEAGDLQSVQTLLDSGVENTYRHRALAEQEGDRQIIKLLSRRRTYKLQQVEMEVAQAGQLQSRDTNLTLVEEERESDENDELATPPVDDRDDKDDKVKSSKLTVSNNAESAITLEVRGGPDFTKPAFKPRPTIDRTEIVPVALEEGA